MTNRIRMHIWSMAVMSLAIFGVLAAVVVLSALTPRVAQADGCDAIADPDERSKCITEHEGDGIDHTDAGHDHGQSSIGMAAANAPSAPVNVRSAALYNMILVRWNELENIGPAGAEISHYVITRTAYSSDANNPINQSGGKTVEVGSTVLKYLDRGLGYNTAYSYTVKAVNKYTIDGVMGSSTGPDSDPVTTITATSGGPSVASLAPPGAPSALTVKPRCDGVIVLGWEAPSSAGKVASDTVGCSVCANQTPPYTGIQVKPGTAMVVSYMVERSIDGGGWATLTDTTESVSYTDVSSLQYGHRYSYRVTAMNNEGRYGEASQVRSLNLTAPAAPHMPRSPRVYLDADNPTHVLFTWEPPAGNWRSEADIMANEADDNLSRSLQYQVQRRPEPAGKWETLAYGQEHQYLNNVSKSEALRNVWTQSYVDENVPNAGSYKYRVAALFDGCQLSFWAVSASEELPEIRPSFALELFVHSNLIVTQGSLPGIVTLSWTVGDNSTKTWIAGIKPAEPDSDPIWLQASSNRSHTFTGLDSGAEYVFTVNAGRGSGANEEWSGWTPFASLE